jgi:hypothetical protein
MSPAGSTSLLPTTSAAAHRPSPSAGGGSRWSNMLVEAGMTAGGIGAAVSEESMKSLKYCLQWLQVRRRAFLLSDPRLTSCAMKPLHRSTLRPTSTTRSTSCATFFRRSPRRRRHRTPSSRPRPCTRSRASKLTSSRPSAKSSASSRPMPAERSRRRPGVVSRTSSSPYPSDGRWPTRPAARRATAKRARRLSLPRRRPAACSVWRSRGSTC